MLCLIYPARLGEELKPHMLVERYDAENTPLGEILCPFDAVVKTTAFLRDYLSRPYAISYDEDSGYSLFS